MFCLQWWRHSLTVSTSECSAMVGDINIFCYCLVKRYVFFVREPLATGALGENGLVISSMHADRSIQKPYDRSRIPYHIQVPNNFSVTVRYLVFQHGSLPGLDLIRSAWSSPSGRVTPASTVIGFDQRKPDRSYLSSFCESMIHTTPTFICIPRSSLRCRLLCLVACRLQFVTPWDTRASNRPRCAGMSHKAQRSPTYFSLMKERLCRQDCCLPRTTKLREYP